MPDCIVDTSLIAAALLGYWQVKGAHDKKRRKKFTVLGKLSQQTIQRDFNKDWPITRNVEAKLPVGADSSAAAALRAVQQYQDHRQQHLTEGLALPSCWLGCFYFSGCQDGHPPVDVETAICEELKLWLLGAAGGSATAEEAAERLQLYHRILMRPETFEAAFLSLIAFVCERLCELSERLAGAVRTCALQLSKVMSIGRDLVNGMMPLLVCALTDAVEDGALPILCVDALAASALDAERVGRGDGALAGLWQRDCGRLLGELLRAPHLLQLWGLGRRGEGPQAAEACEKGGGGVPAAKVEIYHRWEDALDEGSQLPAESGLCELFTRKDSWRHMVAYLNLFENLDKLVKFVSMLGPYKALANIAGDAAMYRLRGTLHHLLQELELVLVEVQKDASLILDKVRYTVVDMAIKDPKQSWRRARWLERLQLVDERAVARSCRGLMAAMAELQYLSCSARLPELQDACQRSLDQICTTVASADFRNRCSELPPEVPRVPLPGDSPAASLESAAPALEDEHPSWSAERQFRLRPDEEAYTASGLAVSCQGVAKLGDVVERLNLGQIPEAGDFCLVEFQETQEHVVLYQPGKREAAVDALGLNTLRPASASSPQQAVEAAEACSGSAKGNDVAAAAEQAPPHAAEGLSEEAQAGFYEVLFAAVLPLFEQDEALTGRQALTLLRRAELPEEQLKQITKAELGDLDLEDAHVDCQTLRRMGQLVAHAQAGCADLVAARGALPAKVPAFRGLLWDERRPKKVSVLEPM